jgi:hypothetical protein
MTQSDIELKNDGSAFIETTEQFGGTVSDIWPLAGISTRASCFLITTRMVEGTLPNRHRLPRGANEFDLFQNKSYSGSPPAEAPPTGVGG